MMAYLYYLSQIYTMECQYVYKCGAKKGQKCERKCRGQYCFQHASQLRKEKNREWKEYVVQSTKEIEQQTDFIQLENTACAKLR